MAPSITEDLWFGDASKPGLRDLFTVYGDGLVNLNTASNDVLALIPDLDNNAIEAALAYRAGDDGLAGTADDRRFANFAHVAESLGVSAEIVEKLTRYCKTESRFFRITGTATRRQGRVRATCSAVCSVVEDRVVVVDWREYDRDA